MKVKRLVINGIRGLPASHGGFETFAEYISLYLKSQGWEVIVYCQEFGKGAIYETEWKGIKLIHIPISKEGATGTIYFDFKSILHSLRYNCVYLTLGYNTAIFNVLYRLYKKNNIINMDGIEWKRNKWGRVAKLWFWLNERFGCWFSNHLVADHPRIKDHLATRVSHKKISMIPYGGLEVMEANRYHLEEHGLLENCYMILIARPEPENSILEIVKGFSSINRGLKLVVLGNYCQENKYHKLVLDSASSEVCFIGPIYDVEKVSTLRYFARCYVHGHQVGGTNPSLVESIGAGNAIIAHDNHYNRWVAKSGAIYFNDSKSISEMFSAIIDDPILLHQLKRNSRENFRKNFRWKGVLEKYEKLLLRYL